MNQLLRRLRAYALLRPAVVGLIVGGLLLFPALFVGINDGRAAAAFDDESTALRTRLAEAQDVLDRARDRQDAAKRLLPSLRPMCGGLPPTADAFVRSMHGWPGLTVKSTGNLSEFAAPAVQNVTKRAMGGGLHLEISGNELAAFGFLVDVDAGMLRRSATVTELSRQKEGDDSSQPAQHDAIAAKVDFRVVMVDPKLCNDLQSVATEPLIAPAASPIAPRSGAVPLIHATLLPAQRAHVQQLQQAQQHLMQLEQAQHPDSMRPKSAPQGQTAPPARALPVRESAAPTPLSTLKRNLSSPPSSLWVAPSNLPSPPGSASQTLVLPVGSTPGRPQ